MAGSRSPENLPLRDCRLCVRLGVVQRVSVVGNSGSGKSWLSGRIAERIGVPYVELDDIAHLPGWTSPSPEALLATVTAVTDTDGWVLDGNYRAVVVEGPVWQRADTVVWADPPRHVVMRQVVLRTAVRFVTRQQLWNGNRERLRDVLSWDPDRSIIRWSWTQHHKYQARYSDAMSSPTYGHIHFIRLRSRHEAIALLASLPADHSH
jgi:adenylate kinase family enzyme